MRKNYFLMAVAAISMVALSSCESEADSAAPAITEFEISAPELQVTREGGDATLTVETNKEWYISGITSTEWITVSQTTGGSGATDVVFTFDENVVPEGREAEFVFHYAGEETPFKLMQSADDLRLSVANAAGESSFEFEFEVDGTAKSDTTVSVTSNATWEASVVDDAEWVILTTDMENNTFSVAALANVDLGQSKTATIKVSSIVGATTKDVEIVVKQDKNEEVFAMPVEPVAFEAVGGTVELALSSIVDWSAELVQDGNSDWFSINQTSGNESITLEITAKDNTPNPNMPKSATLFVSHKDAAGADKVEEIVISQIAENLDIIIDKETISKKETAAFTEEVSVSVNADWSYTVLGGEASWLSITQTEAGFTLSADANSGIQRSETITLTTSYGHTDVVAEVVKTINVIQNGDTPMVLSITNFDPNNLPFDDVWTFEEDVEFDELGVEIAKDFTGLNAGLQNAAAQGRSITIAMPNYTGAIGVSAFQGCTALVAVEMPQVSQLLKAAFSGCTSLTELNLPAVTRTGDAAFQECTSLTTLILPAAVYMDTALKFSDKNSISLTHLEIATTEEAAPVFEFKGAKGFSSAFADGTINKIANLDLVTNAGTVDGNTWTVFQKAPKTYTIAGFKSIKNK